MSKPVVSLLFLVVLVVIIGLMVTQTYGTNSTAQSGKGLPMAAAERSPTMVAVDWATFTFVLAGVVLALLRTRRRNIARAN